MALSKDQRSLAWNVQFLYGPRIVAGIYQRDDLLTIANVARDLDFCLVFPPTPNTRVALLPVTETPSYIIDVDNDADRPFPTPGDGQKSQYQYLFHHDRCDRPHGQHSLQDPCISQPGLPKRRHHASYLGIGQACQAVLANRASYPHSNRRRGVRATCSSASLSQNHSSQKTSSAGDGEPRSPAIIEKNEATEIASAFRRSVLAASNRCVISGKGTPWLSGVPGTGIEAAHIVPSGHWSVYPADQNMAIADENKDDEKDAAWRATWALPNGLSMLAHLHKCFDARLFAIHPLTHQVRTFAPYDVITEFHSRKADIPHVDPLALQHQWNMCCLENMVASWVPREDPQAWAALPRSPVLAPSATSSHAPLVDRAQASGSTASDGGDHGNPTNSHQVPRDQPLEATDDFGLSSRQGLQSASVRAIETELHPKTHRQRFFWHGDHFVDEDEANNLFRSGYDVEEVDAWGVPMPPDEDRSTEPNGERHRRQQVIQWLGARDSEIPDESTGVRIEKRKSSSVISEDGVGQEDEDMPKRQRCEGSSPGSPPSLGHYTSPSLESW